MGGENKAAEDIKGTGGEEGVCQRGEAGGITGVQQLAFMCMTVTDGLWAFFFGLLEFFTKWNFSCKK